MAPLRSFASASFCRVALGRAVAALLALLGAACGGGDPAPVASGFVAPAPEVESSDCTCAYDAHNCPDFSTAAAAQACFRRCQQEAGGDVHRLDRDGDGRACEWNP
ncbi:MAG TPA: excalibur calcium-binding domain-containing protein [Thermoanaerobaculia bacterium]|nr:excalibur calcium-binding domain-containing protein [Thermoanaerobaculia bacterium]